ncbi:hypothetical protein B0H12DRAFT_1071971 [Mycena haematopus]|nr:hypothetical protein B0H12DRAFT_1071971 [Mycena haematopus]
MVSRTSCICGVARPLSRLPLLISTGCPVTTPTALDHKLAASAFTACAISTGEFGRLSARLGVGGGPQTGAGVGGEEGKVGGRRGRCRAGLVHGDERVAGAGRRRGGGAS